MTFEKNEIEELRKINYLGAAWLRKCGAAQTGCGVAKVRVRRR
jgi:hypothetical protein